MALARHDYFRRMDVCRRKVRCATRPGSWMPGCCRSRTPRPEGAVTSSGDVGCRPFRGAVQPTVRGPYSFGCVGVAIAPARASAARVILLIPSFRTECAWT
jgi:hypothetical protein